MTTPAMPNIDLNPHDWAEVQRILEMHVPKYDVWVFGSRATWTAKAYSDLDLAIITDERLPLGIVADLKSAFDESDLSIKVDLVDWATTSESFRKIIRKTAVVVQNVGNYFTATISGWRECLLGELTENFDNVRVPVKGADRRVGSYPYYGASGVVDYIDDYLFDGEYLLIAEDGENLKTRTTPVAFLARGKFWVNNHAHIVKGNAKADTRFLMYAITNTEISGYLTGSTMPKLTQGNMNRIPILTPPIEEQRYISHILGTLDDKIELNRQMNETLEAMARALFKSWFVDFEPVRAKAEGRDTGLPREIADLFPDSFEDSELGEVPKGWGVGKIGDFATLSRNALNPGEFNDELFDHYSLPAFDEGRTPKIEVGQSIKSNKFIVFSDCVLLSKLNPRIPRVWLPFLHDSRRSICSTEFIVARPKAEATREFLYGLFSSEAFASEFATLVTGTSGSHQRVTPESLLQLDAIVPPLPIVHFFSEQVSPMLHRINLNLTESNSLTSTRDTLLPQLLSGEFRVKMQISK